mgnify:CR=1 FL=1
MNQRNDVRAFRFDPGGGGTRRCLGLLFPATVVQESPQKKRVAPSRIRRTYSPLYFLKGLLQVAQRMSMKSITLLEVMDFY